MSSKLSSPYAFGDARTLARTVFGVAFRPQTYRNLCYLTLAFPLGFCYFLLFAVGVPLGVVSTIFVVGVPILLGMLAIASGLASFERRLTTWLLDVEIPTGERETPASLVGRVRRLVTDVGTWTAVVYLGTKLVVGVVAFEVTMLFLVTAVSLLAIPFVYDQPGVYVGVVTDAPVSLHPAVYFGWDEMLIGLETVITVSTWQVDTLGEALAVAGLGVCLLVFTLHLLNALAWLSGRYTRLMLRDRHGDVASEGNAVQ
ncbi:hypothetical protein AUR64_16450 [Haloprofundus marisrubri]|uniref:Putative sensor domain-containing protein n=1 Tax=Haloprofundus marisrubri TaxID=1514971 RepID=A0A0W1R7Q7_9EURY|nr:sensor domain-containing protein [Haloprofundus marisrubri]KTG09369.1 hypothetical protein AUR64_16450 [Haloprofundus marisrubri]